MKPNIEGPAAIVNKREGRSMAASVGAATGSNRAPAAVLQPAFGGVPTVILGPGDTHLAHQTDEYCEVARIPLAVDMFKAIVRDWYADNELRQVRTQ